MRNSIGEDDSGRQKVEAETAQGWIRLIWRIIRPVLVAYLVVLLVMTFLETWLVYPVPPIDVGDWHPARLGQEEVWFQAADGTKLFGWFVPQPNSKRAILYCHGNGEDVGCNVETVTELRRELDASVFIFDYRGYGHSEGRPSEAGCIADGLAADRWLAERTGQKTAGILVMGRSLGGAIAVAIAADQGARALVLDSTFSRMTDVAALHYPWLPVRLLMRNRYDSLSRIRQYAGPVFQSHGTADSIVPIAFARQFFDTIPSEQKHFREYAGRNHNDSLPGSYYHELRSFLDSVGLPTSAPPCSQTR